MDRRLWKFLPFALVLLLPVGSRAAIDPKSGRDLLAPEILRSMQNYMLEKRFDGWLFTGQGSFDDIDSEFLGLNGETRHRWFIFYPAMATLKKPFLIYHADDERVFDGLSLFPVAYRSRREMKEAIKAKIFSVAHDIGVNYSPGLQVPEISRIDAGTVELLQEIGIKVRSSGSLLSFYHTRWTVQEVETHKSAAVRLDSLLPLAIEYLKEKLSHGKKITDRELADYVLKSLKKLGLEPAGPVTLALGANTLKESYEPDRKNRQAIGRDTLVYLEVSARQKGNAEAMFARLGWTLYTGAAVPEGLANSWARIAAAADTALAVLETRLAGGGSLQGWEVDRASRSVLSGDPNSLPRPFGYNLNRRGLRFGVRFDDYLAHDDREVMPGLGFTLEPGIYLPEYALRLCADLFIEADRSVTLTAPLQRRIIAVLGPAGQLFEAFAPPVEN
ncbi:MAG: M24 family metallopeptidase [Candidatus Glassbacteria bacterium]